jgi:polyphenol oxidase
VKRRQTSDVAYYTFAALDEYGEIVHAVTTRHGGVSAAPYHTLNLSKGLGDDPAAVEQNMRRTCAALGVVREHVISPNQRHTANVCRVSEDDRGHVCSGYDALITDRPGVPLLLRYADCTPVLLYDPPHHAIAVIHSGWRGTVQGIASAAVAAMAEAYGSRAADLVAGVGPSIGPCCYEVGPEVVDAVRAAFGQPEGLLPEQPSGRRHFDLWAANRRWLLEAGVRRVEVAELCTACHTADFYSHRAEHGHTGHFGALMELRHDALGPMG